MEREREIENGREKKKVPPWCDGEIKAKEEWGK
jgi:hypothetical protein